MYLAAHPRLPREDALKVLPPQTSADEEYRARFTREADLAASLWHPHIVGVHDRGEFEGRLWIAMDYVDGTDAAQLQREKYPRGMPATEVAPILNAVASALDYAHGRSLLHRDVKPSNILMTNPARRSQRIMLADFGVARRTNDDSGLTTTNAAVGSVAYTAPEQLTNATLDGRADQYALAATAYHLLTGAPPFANPNPAVIIGQRLSSPPPVLSDTHPHLRGLDSAMTRAMARDPKARFATCSDFADAFAMGAVLPELAAMEPPTKPTTPSVRAVPRPAPPSAPKPASQPAPQPRPPRPSMQSHSPSSSQMMFSGWSTDSSPAPNTAASSVPVPSPRASGAPAPRRQPPAAPAIQPVKAKASRSPMPWIVSVVGLVAIVGGIALAVNITGRGTSSVVTSEALTPITPKSSVTATPAATTTSRIPTPTATPPVVPGPDGRNEDCTAGIQIAGQTGWASRAGRGSPETSCVLARGVLEAYWAANPTPKRGPGSQEIDAVGSVPCNSTSGACAGDKFVMHCEVLGHDAWITCTGGTNARVYLY